MTLRNNTEPGLLQGCDVHGFFIDADTVQHTSIANGIDHDAIAAKLADEDAVAAANEKRLEAEQDRDAEKREKEEAEQRLRKDFSHMRTAEERREEAENFLRKESAARALERERKQQALDEVHQKEITGLMVGVGPEVVALFVALEKRVRALESDKQMLETALRHVNERVDKLGNRVDWA
jgi:Fe2+ transport system protein B